MSEYADNGERRVNWARTVADIAVVKEIQIQQTATLAKLDGKLDLLWDSYQRELGSRSNEQAANLRWRWYLTTAVAGLAAVVALIQAKVI